MVIEMVAKKLYRVVACSTIIILFVSTIVLIVPFYDEQFEIAEKKPFKQFSSYEELKNFLKANAQYQPKCEERGGAVPLAPPPANDGTSPTFKAPYHSTTNVQVAGVDEVDIVKTDGKYLYTISNKTVVLVNAWPPEDAKVLARLNSTAHPVGLFVNGEQLVVFEQQYSWYLYEYGYRECPSYRNDYRYEPPRTFIKIYNISAVTNPVLVQNISVNGTYFNSRMIDDYVYVVVQMDAFLENDEVALPQICKNDEVVNVKAEEIYFSDTADYSYTFTIVLATNLHNSIINRKTFLLGTASCMFVSEENIYLTIPQYSRANTERTLIYRLQLVGTNLELVASGAVPGYLLNQFSMDEYDNHFRVATTTHTHDLQRGSTSANHLFVLDMELNIVGSLKNLAPGETIYSARFMGARCYLVTFKKVDPFFVIDLNNPAEPKVLGELKITGYSDYLHPYGENRVIGIGKDTVPGGDTFAWYQGVKISLFDVTDVCKPTELAKYVIGTRGSDSPVLKDHKAFLCDRKKGVLVIPILVAERAADVEPYAYGHYVWQGAYVFNISEQALTLKGRITHLENRTISNLYYWESPYFIERSIFIENALYTISKLRVKINDLESLEELKVLEF